MSNSSRNYKILNVRMLKEKAVILKAIIKNYFLILKAKNKHLKQSFNFDNILLMLYNKRSVFYNWNNIHFWNLKWNKHGWYLAKVKEF